jgi:predicted nuclease of restriction endonuclease-like (RecB) superfamily
MEILISEINQNDQSLTAGFSITFVNRSKKKAINEQDFFADSTEIAQKVTQLKRLLKTYFDAQA